MPSIVVFQGLSFSHDLPFVKKLSKGQGQMAQLVNKASQSVHGVTRDLMETISWFIFCSVLAVVILKDLQGSSQGRVPPVNARNPVFSCPTFPFFLSEILPSILSSNKERFWTSFVCHLAIEKRIRSLLKENYVQG